MSEDADSPGDRRKDVNTRKVIEVLSAKFEEKFKNVVTWERLSFILAAAALAIVTASWVVTTMAAGRAEAAAASAKSDVTALRKESADAIQLVRDELREARTDIRGLYRSVRTNQPQPRLAAPVPELPPNPIAAPIKEK